MTFAYNLEALNALYQIQFKHYKVLSVIACENVLVLQSSYQKKLNSKGNIRKLLYVNEHVKLNSKISSKINRSGAFRNFWHFIQSLFIRNDFLLTTWIF